MRVLVTGGGGYLGCWLVRGLIERGHTVRVFDRFCFGDQPAAQFTTLPRCEVVRGDIRRLQESPGLLDGVDAIAHLAGLTNDPSCDLDVDMTADVNVESTRELASKAVQNGVRRFLLASSCSVYGKGVFDFLDEQSRPNPMSTFSLSKLEAERAVLQMRNGSFEPIVARNATLFGWSPRMRFDVAVNHMVATAVQTNSIKVLGNGNQWRPFLHVRDAARAYVTLLEAPAETVQGEIFNVGSDDANTRIIDLAKLIAGRLGGVKIEIPKEDDDLRNYRVKFGKFCETFSFQRQWSIDEGIAEVHDFLRQEAIDPFREIYFNVQRMKQLLATPVDEGGEPIAARFISIAKPCLGPEEEQAVVDAIRSGWLTSGPHIQAFEEAFGRTVSAANTVAVNSCTAALHLCLAHLDVRPGDEVLTSPLTWASTGNTILRMGARVTFADVRPDTLNINPEVLEAAITPHTKVIMPVHLAGQPCELDAIYDVARRHGIPVVEDAAHALGASYKGVRIGSYGDFACFSFYAIKNITTMEGGTITVKDADAARHLRLLAANGMTATAWERYGRSAVASPAEVVEPGFKYLMSNVSAAMGIEQLKKFASFKASRRRLAQMYRSVLSDIDEITLPSIIPEADHAWHLFIVRLNLARLSKSRDEIIAGLRRENVGTSVNFYGLHLHRYYRETLGIRPEDLPEATAASNEVLSLPLHPQMSDKNVHEVVEALKKVLAHARR
ncbi:MAG: aminotransferase class I/II-fold pyridoxal phosphate-dependent enzyme [Candidatus Hydrogenedentes bacterium]|nr:aminotransferase class I/II-fold pyridoxal phosphate-dependent enzyme [Candidatus Hydrogenedentota bacterium]